MWADKTSNHTTFLSSGCNVVYTLYIHQSSNDEHYTQPLVMDHLFKHTMVESHNQVNSSSCGCSGPGLLLGSAGDSTQHKWLIYFSFFALFSTNSERAILQESDKNMHLVLIAFDQPTPPSNKKLYSKLWALLNITITIGHKLRQLNYL